MNALRILGKHYWKLIFGDRNKIKSKTVRQKYISSPPPSDEQLLTDLQETYDTWNCVANAGNAYASRGLCGQYHSIVKRLEDRGYKITETNMGLKIERPTK